MWLSNRKIPAGSNQSAVGEVTIGGRNTAVYTDGEKRNSAFFSPGGYYWLPSCGQNMVVIKSGDGEVCCMDREVTELPVDMQEGEVYIVSGGNASLYLKNDGTVQIMGDVSVNGRMFVNGTEIG
ncbi:MAG: hypothetical protein E7456_01495 [Ruminococcaceae bacterium]|nr:hypothetical protein [Oscillospiraceae bacterium]